jgi:hypothetical protein
MGPMVTMDGQSARCTLHGGEFRVLLSRFETSPPPEAVPRDSGFAYTLTAGSVCVQHPNVAAVYACSLCGTPICATCAFSEADGRQLCPQCVGRLATAKPAERTRVGYAPSVPDGARCVQHPHLQAVHQCKACGAFMCATCDFALPGGIHVCPACAASPQTSLSPRRKKLLIGSYVLAVWTTIAGGLLLSGIFAEVAETKEGEAILGLIFSLTMLVPSIIGTSLGFSAKDRRLPNPPAVWVAVIWNLLLLGGFVLLCIIGSFM